MITAFRLRFRSNVKAYLALGIGVVIIGWSPLFIRCGRTLTTQKLIASKPSGKSSEVVLNITMED